MKIKIDERVLNYIKQKLINHFKFNQILIDRLNNGCQALYVENLEETIGTRMISRINEISIDKQFAIFDNSGNVIGFDKNVAKLVESQLGHELLHAASREKRGNIGYNGIRSHNEQTKSYINDYIGLNEGITQMFTEDVFDYVVSPFSDGYKDFKKIAKIMRLCLGNKPFLNSYFLHNDMLKEECDKLSGNSFYEDINKALTDLYYLRKISQKKEQMFKQLIIKIYNKRMKACFANVIINLVLPKLNLMQETEKKNFIKEILKVVSDDKERQKEVEYLLERTIKMDSNQLNEEKKKIKLFETSQIQKFELVNLMTKEKPTFQLMSSGEIFYIKDNSSIPIKDDMLLCEYVYANLYESYFGTSFNLDNYIEQIKRTKKVVFPSNYNEKIRRIFFSKIKQQALEKHRIILLNSYLECSNNELNIEYVNKNMSFSDLKTLLNRYELKTDGRSDNYNVIDKITQKQIYDTNIIDGVRFAYLWLNIAERRYVNETIPGMTDAFSEFNEKNYNQILSYMIKMLQTNGNLDYQTLYKYASKNNDKMEKILSILFKNPTVYEWVYKFVSSKVQDKKLQPEKEKSMLEYDSQYNDSTLEIVSEGILKK